MQDILGSEAYVVAVLALMACAFWALYSMMLFGSAARYAPTPTRSQSFLAGALILAAILGVGFGVSTVTATFIRWQGLAKDLEIAVLGCVAIPGAVVVAAWIASRVFHHTYMQGLRATMWKVAIFEFMFLVIRGATIQ